MKTRSRYLSEPSTENRLIMPREKGASKWNGIFVGALKIEEFMREWRARKRFRVGRCIRRTKDFHSKAVFIPYLVRKRRDACNE